MCLLGCPEPDDVTEICTYLGARRAADEPRFEWDRALQALARELHCTKRQEVAMLIPFAVQIYRRFQNGETVLQLSQRLGIPADRIEQRLRAAAQYLSRQQKTAA